MLRWLTLTSIVFAKYTEVCCFEDTVPPDLVVGTQAHVDVPSGAAGCGCQSLKREAGIVGTENGGTADASGKQESKYSQSLNEIPPVDTKSQVVNTIELI